MKRAPQLERVETPGSFTCLDGVRRGAIWLKIKTKKTKKGVVVDLRIERFAVNLVPHVSTSSFDVVIDVCGDKIHTSAGRTL